MISRWQWILRQLTRRLWFRASLLSVLAVATAFVAFAVEPFIPTDLPARIGANAVDGILGILASSLLIVTTFSLSTAVQAHGTATTNVTPRATQLLIEDETTQNVVATFIGGFLYSLVSMIALNTGLYGDRSRVVLLGVTILVILLIVATLLRWLDHLLELGRVGSATDRVEQATVRAMRDRTRHPFLGGRPWRSAEREPPPDAHPVRHDEIGYVQNVDVGALAECAAELECTICVAAIPGEFVDPSQPVAWLDGARSDRLEQAVRRAFTIGAERSFDQDPRFGLAVLAEIATRALSPGLNDVGTAINVLGRTVRVLALWADCDAADPDSVPYPRVLVPPLELGDLFEDVFPPIARDGERHVEVQVRLQKSLRALARLGPRYGDEAVRHSSLAAKRAESGLALEQERSRIRELVATVEQAAHAHEAVSAS